MRTTERLQAPTIAERQGLLARLDDRSVHDAALRTLPACNAVEVRSAAPVSPRVDGRLRIAAWNAERGRHPGPAAALISESNADVVLLSELDVGMARTGQRHTLADLAAEIGGSYAFGVEFVELASGSAADRAMDVRLGTEPDSSGLHGNGVLSMVGLERPAIVRLTADAGWFGGARGEPRVGERMAVLATVPVGSGHLAVAAVHLESASAPDERCREMSTLFDALDEYAAGGPVVIGGDLNTCSSSPADLMQPDRWEALLAEDEHRFSSPVPHEPLFAEAEARGYQWEASNAAGTTTRWWSGSRRWKYAMRLDWILTRGVTCTSPATYAALNASDPDQPISDHDLLAVTVTLAERASPPR